MRKEEGAREREREAKRVEKAVPIEQAADECSN